MWWNDENITFLSLLFYSSVSLLKLFIKSFIRNFEKDEINNVSIDEGFIKGWW